jgi:hypothetical protein
VAEHVPEAWKNETVTIRTGPESRQKDIGELQTVNDRGLVLEAGGRTFFYPWASVLRIELGAEPKGKGAKVFAF